MESILPPKSVTADWVMLCDAAQIQGNKLYILGGGWNVMQPPQIPIAQKISVVVALAVPWAETNQKKTLVADIVDEDGKSLIRNEVPFEVGRPAGAIAGRDQRVQLVFDWMFQIEKSGAYVVTVQVDGVEIARSVFDVLAAPQMVQVQRLVA